MPQRILHIVPSLAQHGTAKQLRMAAEGLAAAGEDVHVCVLAGAPDGYEWCANLAQHGVDSTVLTHRTCADLCCLPALIGRVRDIRPDVIHTWLPAGNVLGRMAARVGGVKRVVSSIRGQAPFASSCQWLVERRCARMTNAIVVNSAGVRQQAVCEGLDERKIHVVPNAVESPVSSSYAREDLQEMLGLSEDARLMGAVGPLVASKNLKQQIWVADIFKGIHEPVHLLLLGDGPQRARLDVFARQIEVRHRIHFLGHREDVLDILPHADVFVSGSQHEGCPNGLLEAMAAGVPAVVTDIAGHRDVIRDGESGFLVPVGSRADAARNVKKLLDDAELASTLGNAAQATALVNHSPETTLGKLRAVYEGLAE